MQNNIRKMEVNTPDVSRRRTKKKSVLPGIVALILLAGVAVSTVISAITLISLKSFIAKQEDASEAEDAPTSEDHVTIAGNYEILPTTAISTAYRTNDNSALNDKQKETLDMAKAALSEMQITDSMTDFEKEKAVYDWMTSHLQQDRGILVVIPTTQEDCDNPYGALKYHNAVCVGYATTFRMFMQMLGIDCMVVHNTECWHTWNAVKVDGSWYYTDIYSDAGIGNYSHLNMTSSMLMQQQSWDQNFFPAANSMKYNVAYMNRFEAGTVFELASLLRAAINEKKQTVMIGFSQTITETEATIANSIASSVDAVLMEAGQPNFPTSLGSYQWVHVPEENRFYFLVCMEAYNGGEDFPELTDEQIEQIQNSVQEAFGDIRPEY